MLEVNEILLRRKNKILCVDLTTNETHRNYTHALAIMKNIESLGFTFSSETFSRVGMLSTKELITFNAELVMALKKLTGADKVYTPMYSTFPNLDQYSDWDLLINALVHYWSDGTLVIAEELKPRMPLVESTELTILELGSIEDLLELRNNLIESKTALSNQDKEDLVWILKEVSYSNLPTEIPFKENMCVITQFIKENSPETDWLLLLHPYFKTATDVLRFATQLSAGDTSLAMRTRFKKFSRKERRLILALLENCKTIEEDMLRYKMYWITLGEILHPGEYDTRYPKTYQAFHKLRENVKIETFNSKVARALADNDFDKIMHLLTSRPGELARRLDHLLREYGHPKTREKILKAFDIASVNVSIPVLLQVREHFLLRNHFRSSRVFFPKGQLTKAYVKTMNNDEDEPFITEICQEVIASCEKSIKVQLLEKDKGEQSWGKIYIDESMKGFVMPQSNHRSASSGMKLLTRCSRIPFEKNFLRFFIHWTNEMHRDYEVRTDIDLSCTFLSNEYQYIDHVSWTHLRNRFSTHSGDFVNAPRPNGVAEFIDVDIEKALKAGVRYAAVDIYGYTETPFCKLESLYMGWMEREEPEMGEIFEPSTVKNKINLSGNTMCSMPMIIDLATKEIIWLDLALQTRPGFSRCIETNMKGITLTTKGLVEAHKPQMYDVLQLNAAVKGEIVTDRNQADIIFDTCTDKPYEETLIEKERSGNQVICEIVRTYKEDVKIITPYDLDFFMAQCM